MDREETYADVAVLIPCFNEELTVGKVVTDFRAALPGASIYVYDNNSTDSTAARASGSGATVVASRRQGKGCVVRHMFTTVESQVYVMVDGDDTYSAQDAPDLIEHFRRNGSDMVVGARMPSDDREAFRRFHRLGNSLVTWLIAVLFRAPISDAMSGFRVFSRDLVRCLPLLSTGFEVEVEMTLQAIAKGYIIAEVPVHYAKRPQGSQSKLSTYSDGYLVVRTIAMICKDYKPILFFTAVAAGLAVLSLVAGWGPVEDYLTTGFVPRFPRAILAAALGILSALSLGVGVILETVVKFQRENFEVWKRLRGS